VRAFTLIDTLISIAVIVLLIGLLTPSLSSANEVARRIACASNLRQIGLGLAMYADDWNGRLPPSVFLEPHGRGSGPATQEMVTLRLSGAPGERPAWDGLGLLFAGDYLPAPRVFYCPSHRGEWKASRMLADWRTDDAELVGNFHYRGVGPNGTPFLSQIDPQQAALVADALRSSDSLNHPRGLNVLGADLVVAWVADSSGELSMIVVPEEEGEGDPQEWNLAVQSAWTWLDRKAGSTER
jgi:type II secretory pathway pseudopilin PulG